MTQPYPTRPIAGLAALLATISLLCSPAAPAGPSVLQMKIGDPDRKSRTVELRLDTITDTASGESMTPQELAARLSGVGLLFIGENHTNLDFHTVQLRIIRELHRAGRDVLIGLEMFPTTQQASLDRWIAGEQSEREFVEQAEWYRYWGYRWEYYREIFLFARENALPMVAINTPRDIVKSVRNKDFKDLTPEEAKYFLYDVLPVTDDQRRMFKGFFASDDALHMNEAAMEGMLRAQSTWDATMGWNALRALQQQGGENSIMVVLIGAGHVTYGLGSERQTAPHYDGRIASVIPVEVYDDEDRPVNEVQASYANFIWGLPKQQDTVYPRLGISLMGKIGQRPTQIIQVEDGSVAERSGLQVGDVLLAIDEQPVGSADDLRRAFAPVRWGDVVTAQIERGGEQQALSVEVRRHNKPRMTQR